MTDRPCGCCEPGTGWVASSNRPGLREIAYRFADQPAFFERMLEQLHRSAISDDDGSVSFPLAAVTTRSTDDPLIALIDAAAVVGDILTFYQERIANEGFLGTATERRSVLELAREIGYELHPGASAATHVAFVLDDAAPHRTTVPAGTRVDSMPSGGALPQTFQTTADLSARFDWNAMRPLASVPQHLALVGGQLRYYSADIAFTGAGAAPASPGSVAVVSGPTPTSTVSTAPVDVLRLIGTGHDVSAGDRLLFVGTSGSTNTAAVIRVVAVRKDAAANLLSVVLEPDADPNSPEFSVPVEAAEPRAVPPALPGLSAATADAWVREQRWRDSDLRAFLAAAAWDEDVLTDHLTAAGAPTGVTVDRGVFAFDVRSPVFGHNAPLHDSLTEITSTGDVVVGFRGADPFETSWDASGGWSVFRRYPADTTWPNGGIRLARVTPDIAAGSWAVLEQRSAGGFDVEVRRVSEVWEESVTGFSLSAEVTAIGLGASITPTIDPRVRRTTVYARSRPLPLAPLAAGPVLQHPVDGGADVIVLDRFHLGLRPEQRITVRGVDADLDGVERAEIAEIERVEHHRGRTVLFLTAALGFRAERSTVTINANTVAADHGASADEVLGSGRATVAHQRFSLSGTGSDRLTHVAATTASGIAPALEVRVNGVRWRRVDALFGSSPDAEVYEVRIADDGTATVGFGDGVTGSRLPTGAENVTAAYRVGLGSAGEVAADALTLLPARPERVASVSNAVRASGAQDPERLADARRNAPLTVRTLDRIVSPSDYADFARSYAGIGKAHADRVWDGRGELMVITVGSSTGIPLEDSKVLGDLTAAIEEFRDPVRPIRVLPLAERTFDLAAKVIVDDRFDVDDVVGEVDRRLRAAFSYDARDLATPATKSQVVAIVHDVDGVVAIDLDLFAPTGEPGVLAVIEASSAQWSTGSARCVAPAQLLLVSLIGVELTGVRP